MSANKMVRAASVVLALATWLAVAGTAGAATYTWSGGASAPWSTSSTNWTNPLIATPWDASNGSLNVADFNSLLATPALTGAVYVNGMQFDNTANITGGTINLLTGTLAIPTITVNASGVTVGSVLTGSAGLTKSGSGILTLTGANTYTGVTSIPNAGGGFSGGSQITLANPSGAAIQGNVTIGNNTGGTTNGAALFMGAANQFGPNSVVSYNAASSGYDYFILNGFNQTVAGLSSPGESAANSRETIEVEETGTGKSATLTINNTADYTYQGIIRSFSGGSNSVLSLVKQGPNSQSLLGAQTYKGNISVQNGTLVLGNYPYPASGGTAVPGSALAISSGATFTCTYGNGDTKSCSSITGGGTFNFKATGSYNYYPFYCGGTAQTMAMDAGALFHVMSGNMAFGYGYSAHWINNKANLTIDSGANLYLWDNVSDGNGIRFDALNGAGGIAEGENSHNTLYLGVANSSGTYAGVISDNGGSNSISIVKTGTGTQTFTSAAGASTYIGTTTVSSGGLLLNGGTLSASSAVSVSGSGTFGGQGKAGAVTVATGGTLQGGYNGVGGVTLTNLTFSGSGAINLTPAVGTYTGVNVTASNGLNVGGGSTVTININNTSPLAPGTYALLGYAGSISGTGGFSAFQLGVTPLTVGIRPRTYGLTSAAQYIDLSVVGDAPIWTGSLSTAWETTTQNWKLASNGAPTTYYASDAVTFDDTAVNPNITINNGNVAPANVFFNNNSAAYTISGSNGITGAISLSKSGNATLTINNANSYSTGTTLYGGTLNLAASSAAGTGLVTVSAGTLNVSAGGAVGSGGVTVSAGVVNANASGAIGGPLTLNGGAANITSAPGVVTGQTTVGGGTLNTDAAATLGGNFTLNSGLVNIGNAGALGAGVWTFGGGSLNNTSGGSLTLANPSAMNWTGNFAFLGSSDLNLGTAAVSLAVTPQVTVANGNLTAGGAISGAGGLTKAGSGNLLLPGALSYTGTTNVQGGNLVLANFPNPGSSSAVNAATGVVTIASGATLTVGYTNGVNKGLTALSGAGTFNLVGTGTYYPMYDGGTVQMIGMSPGGLFHVVSGDAALGYGYSANWNNNLGSMTVDSGATFDCWDFGSSTNHNLNIDALSGLGTLTKTTYAGTVNLTVGVAGGSGTFAGTITNSSGTLALVKTGSGSQSLSGLNSYNGGTSINGGVLSVANAGALGTTGTIGFGGGTLQYAAGGTTDYSARFSTAPSQPVSVDTNGQTVTWATGLSSSGGSLFKTGGGNLVLTGTSSYSGPTTANAGKLYVNGALNGTSGVTVNAGGVLGGTGNVYATATVNPGGAIEAGYSGSGALSLSALTFNGSGGVNFGNLTNYTSAPGIVVTGYNGLTTTGNNSITIGLTTLTATGIYQLIGYSGAIQGSGSSAAFQLPALLPNRATASLIDTGSQIDLNVTSFDSLVWTGSGNLSNGWDTATQNWKLHSNGSPTAYIDNPGDTVVFDDTAGTNTTVAISAAAVHPNGVTFNNSAAAYVLNGPYGIGGSTSLIKNNGGSLTINNSNSFSGGLVVNGGLVNVNAAQSFTGGVTINNGTVQIGNAAALGANSVTFGPGTTTGTLQLGGISIALGALTTNAASPGTAVVQNGNSAPATLTLNPASAQTFAGTIQDGSGGGALSLTKTGAGTMVLAGSLAYSGPTLVASGELDTSYAPASVLITVNSGATLALKSAMSVTAPTTISGPGTATDVGALRNDVGTGNTTSYNGTITLNGNTTIRNQSGTLNLGPIASSGGTASLTLIGVGSTNPIYLNATCTYTGATTIKGTGNTNATLAAVYLGATNALPNANCALNNANLWLNGFDQELTGTAGGGNTVGIYNGSSSPYTPTLTFDLNATSDPGYLASGHSGNDARFNLAVMSSGTGSTYYNFKTWGNNNVYTGNTTVYSNAYLQMGQAGQSWDTPPASFVANCLTLNGGGIVNQNGNSGGFVNDIVAATQGITLATSGGYLGAGGSGNTLVINSVISGSGALNVTTNLGTLVLAASNIYSGNTVIGATGPGYNAAATGANVQLGVANALPNGPGMGNLSLPLAGSSLDLNGFATTVNGIGGIGVVTNSNATTTAMFSVGANDAVTTFGGTIQNNIALSKVGSGTLTLTGALTYTGATTIAKGGVVLGAGTSLPATTALTFGGGAATANSAVLDLGGNNQTVAGLAVSSASPSNQVVTNNSATTDSLLTFNGGATPATFPGAITGGANGHTIALTVSAGTLTLSGTNTFTGATAVNSGALYVNGSLNAAATTPISVTGTLGGKGSVGAVSINPGAILEAGQNGTGRLSVAGSLTFGANATVNIANVVAGSIAQYSGSAAIAVNGPLTANASYPGVVNLYLGTGVVNSGTYHLIGYTGGLQLNGAQFTDTFQVMQAPTLITGRQTGGLANDAGSIDYVVVGGSPVWSGLDGGTTPNNSWEVNPSLSNWKVTIGATTSPTDYRVTDSVTFDDTAGAGNTTVAINTADVWPVNVLFANQTLSYTVSGSQAIGGPTAVTKNNAGLVALDNSNSFTGGLFVNGGVLQLNANNAFSGGATISGGLLQINSANSFSGGVAISGGSVQLGDPGAMNASNPNTVTFGPNPAAGARLQLMGNSVTIGGLSTDPVTPGAPVVENGGAADAVLTVNNSTVSGGTTFAGVLQDGTGGGKLAFTKDGYYDVTLAGVNTYSGSTTIVYGTLHVGNNGAIPSGPGKGDVTINGGNLDLAGFTANVNGLWGSGTIDNSAGNGTLVAGNNNATSTFSGAIQNTAGAVALTKTGNGALTLTGANTYSGPTTVNAGTLVLANGSALPSGAATSGVTVNSSGTLDVAGQAVTTRALFGSGTITSNTVGGVLTVSGTAASAFSGVIADRPAGATMGLTKNTFSVLTLGGSAANAYSGETTLMNGVIKLQKSNGAVAIPGNILITGNPSWVGLPNQSSGIELYANEQTGGEATVVAFDDSSFTGKADFRLRGYTTTIGGLQYTGNSTRAIVANGGPFDTGDSGSGTLKIDVADGQTYSFNGEVVDTTAGGNDLNRLNLVKMGSGTQVLGSQTSITSALNSFSGNITVNAGTLVGAAVSSGGNTAFGAASNTRTITVNAGGTLEFDAPNTFGGHNATTAPTLVISGGTVTNADPAFSFAVNNSLNNVTLINGLLTSTAGNNSGYAAWNINGTITSSGMSMITTSSANNNGQVMLNSAASHNSTFNILNGTLEISAPLVQDAVDGNIDSLTMTGSGTLILDGTNTYSGGTSVNSGTLILNGASSLLAGSSLTIGSPSSGAVFAPPTHSLAVSPNLAPVPEPGTLALLAVGALCGLLAYRSRRGMKTS